MGWPLASQFSAMLQRPEIAFRDPVLKRYRIELDRFRQPRPWAGSFAVVYKAIDPETARPLAVRVFTTESPERRQRYEAISEYLQTRRPECLVDFEYRDDSVRAAGHADWFPVILMEWVDGETLFRWLRHRCREGNRQALGEVAARWLALVDQLEGAGIAHGDFQHANVMVTPQNTLKLVDYDGMCVPALAGRRNMEVGVEPYQHPQRNEQTVLSPHLDRFSALLIYTALSALAARPALWMKYIEAPDYDKLLFRNDDLRDPANSPLVADLAKSPDATVRELVDELIEAARTPIDAVGPLRQLANPSYAKIERLLAACRWREAVELLNRRGRFRDAPPHLKTRIQDAYQQVCREDAWSVVEKLPHVTDEAHDRRWARTFNDALFADYPPAQVHRAWVEAAGRRVAVLERLARMAAASEKSFSPAGESAIAEAAEELPAGYRFALASRVELARFRLALVRQFEAAVENGTSEGTIAATWRALVDGQCQAPAAAAQQARAGLAQNRLSLLTALRQIPAETPLDQFDRRLLEIWKEPLLNDCAEASPWRSRFAAAKERRGVLHGLASAVAGQDDERVAALADDSCLEGYPLSPRYQAAIRDARLRCTRADALQRALAQGNREAFAAAFDARLIRRQAQRFAPRGPQLFRWIQESILSIDCLGLGPAIGRANLVCVDPAEGTFRVRWTWPEPRFADRCVLAVCEREPTPGVPPDGVEPVLRLEIDRALWESGGGSRLVHVESGWRSFSVVVWAMVDVGLRVFPSHPLPLGSFRDAEAAASRGGPGWHVPFASRGTVPRTPLASTDAYEVQEDKGDRG
jgi:serine/threonine protein kinase